MSTATTKYWNEENTVENPILDWLQSEELGWTFEDQKTVTAKYRTDEVEVLLLPILRQKLKDLNPGVITDDDRADTILNKLRVIRDNAEWFAWMRNEKTYQFSVDENSEPIRLIDYENIDENDFLCTNQFWVDGGDHRIRTDVLLFVNGIPLVNIEAKTTARDWHVDWTEGAKQCGRYLREAPQLYHSNVFCVGVNELTVKYGVPGVKFHYWQTWRDAHPHTHIDEDNEMMTGIFGLCDRGNLLDILQSFVVFDTDQGQQIKKVTRWQQFGAANEIVDRALQLDKPRGWRRGLVWHTQGSGKSLTMLFAARKLWFHEDMKQPTIIVIVDRSQLQDQISGQFFRTNTENCYVTESRLDLLAKLREGYRGIIVTIMQKFQPGDFQVDRSNVIVLVDEAHRTQEGDLGTAMRYVLKEASLFGFTGTPIEIDDHNTPRAFGRELSTDDTGVTTYERYLEPRYSIADSIRDGATLRLVWEPSPRDWKLWGKELDAKFESTFGHLPEGEREQLKKENAAVKVMATLPDRVADIAKEVAEDFVARVRPNKFKAMLVCYNKEAVALYKAALDKLLGTEASIPIFSDVNQKAEKISQAVKDLDMPSETRAKAIREFRKLPSDKPEDQEKTEERWRRAEIVIVCDMLLTGFDAPVVQTMYLDKGLRNHTLLQAIARVNRPYNELKKEGRIKDFWGVFGNLNEALRYDKAELGDVAFPLRVVREEFKLHLDTLLDLLKAYERSGTHASLVRILKFFNKDEPARDNFENGYGKLRQIYELLEPDDFLMAFRADYVWLSKLFMVYRKKFYPLEKFETSDEDGGKTRELIREHVDVDTIKKEFPQYVLDENYLTKLDDIDPDSKALDIEAMLSAELKIRVDQDPKAESLSEKLKRIINQKRNGALQGIALISALEQLAAEVVDLVNEDKKPVGESIANAAMEINTAITPEQATAIATALVQRAAEVCFPNWYRSSDARGDLYLALTTVLVRDFKDSGLQSPASGFVDRAIRLLEKTRFGSEARNANDS
ncbi:type I restriction endonuclease subunit R [Rosistilla oblonga]|uniref:type I restriction endonuclease subunit R n=1 Tax=Rosistilla oblonga TaxID=2527990 RepID=UPI003A982685